MKLKVAILDNDINYLDRLTSTFNSKYADKLEVYSFTEKEKVIETLKKVRMDVLLTTTQFEIKDEELDKLQSNLKEVMLFIKYSKDKRKLKELTTQSPGFRSLELKAARVIDSITGINLRFTETEGSVNMCQAVQEMCDDARAEGLSQGHAQGLQEQALLTAQRMLQDPSFSPEDISRFSGLPLEDVLKLREK